MREADEYINTASARLSLKMVEAMGVHLSAGESIEFIILDQSGRKKPEKPSLSHYMHLKTATI